MKKNRLSECYIFFIFLFIVFFMSIFYIFLTRGSFFVFDDYTMLDLKFNNYKDAFFFVDLWWRPLKSIFYNFYNINFYLNAQIIIMSKIIIHASLSLIILKYLLYLKYDKKLVLLLSLLFFSAQTSVAAVIWINTADNLFLTLFGTLSFIFLNIYIANIKKLIFLIFSFICYILTVLSKETSITFLCINLFCIFYYSVFNVFDNDKKIFNINKTLAIIAFFLIIFISYFYYRNFLGAKWVPQFNSGRTDLIVGQNTIINMIFYFVSIFSPIDNSFIYFLFIEKKYLLLSFFISFLSIIYFIIFYKTKFSKKSFFFLLLLIISSIPTVFLNHISELYTYISVFFYIMFIIENFNSNNFLSNNLKYFFILTLVFFNFISFIFKTINTTYLARLSSNIFYEMSDSRQKFYNQDIYYNEINYHKYNYSQYKTSSLIQVLPIIILTKYLNYNSDKIFFREISESNLNFNKNISNNVVSIYLNFHSSHRYFDNFFQRPCILIQYEISQKKEVCG